MAARLKLLSAVVILYYSYTVFKLVDIRKFSWREQQSSFCEAVPNPERQSWNTNKKVISYSLFAPTRVSDDDEFTYFFDGVMQNIKDARLYYPEWIVRIYSIGLNSSLEQKLTLNSNTELVRCKENSLLTTSTSRKMISRFLSMDDEKVSYTIFRDADSRLTPRELFAVNDWIASDLGFHVMRDHKHHSVPVLGGMFGAKRGVLGHTINGLMMKAFLENPAGIQGVRGEDQSFLKSYVWKKVRHVCLAHDIDIKRCKTFGSQSCVEFPIGDRNETEAYFVGAAFKSKTSPSGLLTYKCHHTCTIAPVERA